MQKRESKPSKDFHTQDLAKVIAKCWNDEEYKERFIQNPKSVLKEEGIASLEKYNLQVHENTESEIHLVIPNKGQGPLSEQDLKNLAGGGTGILGCTPST